MQQLTDIPSLFSKYSVQKYAVQPLTYRYYKTLDLSTSVWTEKTDGERETLAFQYKDNVYIIETEKYIAKNKSVINYLFDIDVFESKNIQSQPFLKRYECMKKFLELYTAHPVSVSTSTGKRGSASSIFTFHTKSFYSIIPESPLVTTFPLSPYVSDFRDLYNFVYDNHRSPITQDIIDGVIIQTDTRVYKFKRDVLNTNDFYIRCCGQNKFLLYAWNGNVRDKSRDIRVNYRFHRHAPKTNEYYIPGHTLFVSPFSATSYLLDVSKPITPTERKLYFTEESRAISALMKQMVEDNYKFSNKIIELSWTGERWLPVRLRPDREAANYYGICINNAGISFAPINPYEDSYFEMNINANNKSTSITRFSKDDVINFHNVSKILRKGLYDCVNSFMKDTGIGKFRKDVEKMVVKRKDAETTSNDIASSTSTQYITELALFDDDKREITFDYISKNYRNKSGNKPPRPHTSVQKITTIDLAGGRGGDLTTLLRLGTTNLIAVDVDKPALSWYAARVYETESRFYFNALHCDISSDLSTDACLESLRALPEYNTHTGADIIYCNFAIHYLLPFKQNINLFLQECCKRNGSIFVFTYYDSDACKKLSDSNPYKPKYVIKNGIEYANMPVLTFDSNEFREEPAVNNKLLKDLVDENQFEIYEYDDIFGEVDVSKYDKNMIEYFKCLRLRICYKGHAEWRDEDENETSGEDDSETDSDSGEDIVEDDAETTSNETTTPENIPEHLSNIYVENSSSSNEEIY